MPTSKARQPVLKRPAMSISSFPALSPVAKAPPAPAAGQLWHGGPKVQKPWLKQVQKSFTLCRDAHKPKTTSKSRGSAVAFQAHVPPPMPEVLMSLSLMAQWNARWTDDHVNSKDWRPEKNLINVAGRPVGIIVCSHLDAGPIEWDSYQTLLFKPCRVVVLLGPTGKSVQAPTMANKFTVIEWWKVLFFFIGSLLEDSVIASLFSFLVALLPQRSAAVPTVSMHM